MDAPPPQYEGPPTPPPSATPEGIAKTAPWYPPGGMSVAIHQAQQKARSATAAARAYLISAAVMHALAIPVSLVLFKVIVERAAGRSVSWSELWDAVSRTPGGLPLIVGGVAAQVTFAIVAGIGAIALFRGRRSVAIPMIVAGVAGMAFSIIVFGGFVGLIGGALSVAGGVKARVMPALTYTFPPPYYGPPPYRP